MIFRKVLLAAVASLGMVGAANAAPVTGQISLNGYAEATGSAGFGAATGIAFANGTGTSVSGSSGAISSYGAESGSFATLGSCTGGSCGTIKNITTLSTAAAPISSFLTLTTIGPTVTFDLSSITAVRHDSSTDAVSFAATGVINFSGYDPTAGTFLFTAQGDNITSFSATTLAVASPEPASLAILGGSLAAFAMLRRKRA
jgi:hypothetical protein